jgi:hypothetical protein
MTNKLPHDHNYPVSAGVGLVANRTGTINPSDEITAAEWDEKNREEQKTWLDQAAYDWAINYFDYGWLIDGN